MLSIEKLKTKTTLTKSDAQECSTTSVVKMLTPESWVALTAGAALPPRLRG